MRTFFLLLFLFSTAQAEYRVYLLEITNSTTQETRTIRSTLAPEAYRRTYGLSHQDTVAAVGSWKCKGNTSSFRPLCASEQSPELVLPRPDHP